MIFTNRKITISGDKASMDKQIVLYRGDREVEIQFEIVYEAIKYRTTNAIESINASFGQLVIQNESAAIPTVTDITPTNEGVIIFKFTKEMIDELPELGIYNFQIRLFDDARTSRITIPVVENSIIIKEPLSMYEGGPAEVGTAVAGVARASQEEYLAPFDELGNYNETTWATGDIITSGKLNKLEDGITGVNQKVDGITVPTKTSDLTNDSGYATETYVTSKITEAQLGGTSIDDTTTATNKTWSSSKIDSQIKEKAEKQEKKSNNLINNILEEVGTVIDNNIAWELGTVLSNGYKADHAKAIRFVDFIYVSKGSIISLKQYGDDSYKLGVTGFSKPVHSKDNVLFASGWQKEDYIIPQDGYIKACIWYTNDVTDTSSSQAFNSIMFTKEIKNDVSSLKNDVDVLNNQLQYTDSINSAYFYEKIPDYYKFDDSSMSMYLNSCIMSILSSTSDYTILFYTDYHYAKNALNSHDIIAYIKDRVGCNDIVFGGDLLGLEATKEKANYAMTKYGNEVYNKFGKQYKFVFGNHDLNVAGASAENLETQRLSYNDVYEKLIFPNYKNLIFEKNDLTVNSDEWSRERLHYYYDNLKEKIRVIILDTGTTNDYLANGGTPKRLKYQYDWVADVLSKTPDGYSVIVFGHEFYYTYNDDNTPKISDYAVWLAKILKGAKNKETVTFTDYGNITYNYDFTNSNDINIIGMFSGHVHCDYMGVVEEINSVVTTCDAYNATNIHSTPMTLGDITEQAIDIITINKNKRTVTIHRIGAGERKRSFQY